MSDDVLIRVEGVSKKFCRDLKRSLWYGVKDTVGDLLVRDGSTGHLRRDEFWAVDDVSFELRRGECLGLIGRNGAGKTTLLKMLNGLIKPDRGRIEIRGRVGALIALGAGFNPILTGRENIYINGSVLGLSRKEILEQVDDIIDFAEIGDFIDVPVQSYSSGMQVRLGFAIATAMRTDILLLDEVLAVGDAAFASKCFDRIGKLLAHAAVMFVSHNEAQIYRICNQALLLTGGKAVARGVPDEVLAAYRLGQGSARPQESLVSDPRLSDIRVQVNSTTLQYGGELEASVSFESQSECKIGAVFLNFWRNGTYVASGDVMLSPQNALPLQPGRNELRIGFCPVNLQAGRYSVSVAAFDETRKRTILHWLHFAEVAVEGPVGGGTPYRVPMTVTLADQQTRCSAAADAKRRELAAAIHGSARPGLQVRK